MYANLRDPEKTVVREAVMEIDGDYDSIHLWWEALDCRQMSIATGYAQPRYCSHFVNAPKANEMNTLTEEQEEVVAIAGYALATGMNATFDEIKMSDLWQPFTAVPALPLVGLGILGLLLAGRGAWLRRRAVGRHDSGVARVAAGAGRRPDHRAPATWPAGARA